MEQELEGVRLSTKDNKMGLAGKLFSYSSAYKIEWPSIHSLRVYFDTFNY